MKKLALLFLALPLAACATPKDVGQLRLAQAAEARSACTAENKGPSDPHYGQCVNAYLESHYRWQVMRQPDGSLVAGYHRYQGTVAHY